MARLANTDMLTRTPAPARPITPLVEVAPMVEGSKTLAGMLLAAALASLLVVADQVISTWSDGHLLAGWVALWTVAFGALAFLATPLRRLSSAVASGLTEWWAASKARRQEEHMWEFAQSDRRLTAELQNALQRSKN